MKQLQFQGGPLDAPDHPHRIVQVFASDGIPTKNAPDERQLRVVHGSYEVSFEDEESVIYEWKGTKP
jgi:hypothetical protein